MSTYPNQIDNLATDVEDRDRGKTGEPDKSKPAGAGFHAQLHNHANAAITAVEQTLGIEPQGDAADVAARLAAIDTALTGADADLATAVATLTASVNAKQDAASATTDTELAAAVSTINSALASEITARQSGDSTVATAASTAQAIADAALPKAGGTMTGALTLVGDPTANLHPATKQYLEAKIAALVNGAPGTLDTLKEVADRLGSDESAVATLTSTVAGKLGAAANLSDLVDAVAARTNLDAASATGLTSEQTAREAGDSAEKGRAEAAEALKLTKSENLNDLSSASTARTNLGLGTSATKDVGAAGEAGKVLKADDATTGALAEVHIVNLGTDWSSGDLLGARVTTPPAAHKRDVRDGTAASPVKLGVTESISRVDATTRAELNAMGPKETDGPDGASAVRISVKGTAASEVQVTSLTLRAWQTGTYAGSEGSADATPLMALARVSGGGTGRAIPAYFEAVRETSTSKGLQGIEIRVKNESGEDDSYASGSASKSMGVWLCAQGANRLAAAFQIGANFGQKFDVGYAANSETLVSAFMRDDSKALRSVFIRGEHEKGAIVVNKGAGQVIIGREEPQQGTPLLEVFSDTALDPIVSFGSNTGLSQRAQLIRNASGNMGAFVSNVANAFLTGTAQGDVGLTFTAGKILHIGAATKASQLRISETGIGFFTTNPQTKPTSVPKTAEGIWAALNTLGLIA